MAFTYTTLKTAIQDYTQNSETTFVNQLNTFIVNAEERILKEVQLSVFRKNSERSTSAGNQFLSKPTDFLAPYSLSVKNGSNVEFLLYKQVTFYKIITQIVPLQVCLGIMLIGTTQHFYCHLLLQELMICNCIIFIVLTL